MHIFMEFKANPMIRTSVLISPEFYKLSKDVHIKFSEAMKVGISLLLAERGIKEYDNNLNIFRKMQILNQKLSETSQELYNLKEKWETETTSKAEEKNIK